MCFEERCLINSYRNFLPLCCTRIKSIKYIRHAKIKLDPRIFVYFTKTLAATWSVNNIIPASIALFWIYNLKDNTCLFTYSSKDSSQVNKNGPLIGQSRTGPSQ